MLVGVLSDTHLHWDTTRPGPARAAAEKLLYGGKRAREARFREAVERHFRGVELILHAGDLVEPGLLDYLRTIAPVEAVLGNKDRFGDLPDKQVLTLAGHRLGLIHGSGAPGGVIGRIAKRFADDGVEFVVFGHTHRPTDEVRDGVRYFNPGSPTDRVFAPYQSLGLLDIGRTIEARLIRV